MRRVVEICGRSQAYTVCKQLQARSCKYTVCVWSQKCTVCIWSQAYTVCKQLQARSQVYKVTEVHSVRMVSVRMVTGVHRV